jgi:hypothetical protein
MFGLYKQGFSHPGKPGSLEFEISLNLKGMEKSLEI